MIGRFGFLLFICLLAREATAVSIEKIDEGRKAEIYRELAEHDMPTGLRNRNAYDEWVSENARDRETAIVTFDLNDLKRCNDTFGHAAGDKYIQDAAKLISEVFEPAGVCYRIGGDEFCAVIRHARSEWVEERLRRLEYLEWKYNEGKMDVPMRIAYGYAIFDEQYDKNMEETRNRADVKMYEKKRECGNSRIFSVVVRSCFRSSPSCQSGSMPRRCGRQEWKVRRRADGRAFRSSGWCLQRTACRRF